MTNDGEPLKQLLEDLSQMQVPWIDNWDPADRVPVPSTPPLPKYRNGMISITTTPNALQARPNAQSSSLIVTLLLNRAVVHFQVVSRILPRI